MARTLLVKNTNILMICNTFSRMNIFLLALSVVTLSAFACQPPALSDPPSEDSAVVAPPVRPAAHRTGQYLPLLANKNVAMVVNHTSLVGDTHLVDTLLAAGVRIKHIFAPEHGFRGEAANGEHVQDNVDVRTGLPIVSLYGKNRKPTADQLAGIDVVVFDIQDVGARFYTYISTMHYVMETCAEVGVPMVILDRPNPNGFYVGGPVRQPDQQSFLGMHPIPIVHGLTVGELAQMINGEGWLTDSLRCEIEVIPVENYTHASRYSLPVRPSPNLPTDESINLYPSLCLFEATNISLGRGTPFPFQVLGHPQSAIQQGILNKNPSFDTITFTPEDIPGVAFDTKHRGERCYGVDLRTAANLESFTLKFVLDFYRQAREAGVTAEAFFDRPDAFALLAGNKTLQQQIIDGLSEAEITESWEPELSEYKAMRKRYLLYEDFE